MSKSKYRDWVEFIADGTVKIELASQTDAEACDIVICRLMTTPLLLPDNLVAPCSKCWRMVQFRPHAPKTPPRVCDECALPIVNKRSKEEGVGAVITDATARDLAEFLKRKSRH